MSVDHQPAGAWSRRRASVRAEAEALEQAKEDAALAESHAVLAEKPEAEVLEELNLPDPDAMQAGDDFSAFMKSTVPSALRNRALRKLWLSNPALANVDMLVDYGEDFTGKNDVIGAIKTVYQVGKGMLKDKEEAPVANAVAETPPEAEVEPEVQEPAAVEAAPIEIAETPAVPEQAFIAPRRRMKFEFAEGDSAAPTQRDVA